MSFDVILPFLRPIEHQILDPDISESMVNGSARVFIERRGRLEEIFGATMEEKTLQVAIKNIARRLGDEINDERPHFVTVQNLTDEVYQPSNFAEFRIEESRHRSERNRTGTPPGPRESQAGASQSERDWAFALRALARGDDPQQVARAIEANRQDKPNPRYYAEYTVEKALAALNRTGAVHVETGGDERSR